MNARGASTLSRALRRLVRLIFNRAFHCGAAEVLVFERQRQIAVDEEYGAETKLGAETHREPDAIGLAGIANAEPQTGNVGAQHGADHEWEAPRKLGIDCNGLELGRIDDRFARPIEVLFVGGPERDAVDRAILPGFRAGQDELVLFLLLAREREEIFGKAVLGFVVRQIVAEVPDQAPVEAFAVSGALALISDVATFVPVAAVNLLQLFVDAGFRGCHQKVADFFARKFAVRMAAGHFDVLLVDERGTRFLGPILVGGDTGHDLFDRDRRSGRARRLSPAEGGGQ
jgi:hypothetical protein